MHTDGSCLSSAGVVFGSFVAHRFLFLLRSPVAVVSVIATVGSAAKAELAKASGADFVINYNEQDFKAEVAKITGGVGVNAVFGQ